MQAKAYRMLSDRAPAGWTGIVNHKGYGIDNPWTFMNMHRNNSEQGGTINYGIAYPIENLNPINCEWRGEAEVLSQIYDSLLNQNPYSLSITPSLAESFDVGKWRNPESGMNCTKYTFHLRDDIYWHDGTPFTSEDVKFTIDYLLQFKSWLIPTPPTPSAYYSVSAVKAVDAPDPHTVVVYMEVQSYWTIYDVGGLFVIPKNVWQNISKENATGKMPDPSLVGTGPFKSVEYVEGSHALLETNANYFMYCPLRVSISTRSERINPNSTFDYNITVKNCFSEKTANTTVSVYFDKVLIENATLSLETSEQVELGPFNVEHLEAGLQEIQVQHFPDSYLDRTCTVCKHVWSTITEDLNLDLKVDTKDILSVAKAFGSYPGNERWSSPADVNQDDKVDIRDVLSVAKKFGWNA
jgi:hypothetical protein